MSKNKTNKISTFGSQATSIVSVALVLLIVGILASLGIATGRLTNSVLGDVSVIVKIDPASGQEAVDDLRKRVAASDYAASVTFTTADEVLAHEMEYNSEILSLLDENPYSAEMEVKLRTAYVQPDSIMYVSNMLMYEDCVEDVVSQADVVQAIDTAYRKVSLILIAIAAVMMVISLVLIYNTVSIAVYGRRFIIRTMQLVGATPDFIRRPFLRAGILAGVIAALLASAMLLGLQSYVASLDIDAYVDMPWQETAMVCGSLVLLGVAICGLAAYFATNRYLRATDEMLYS